MKFIHTTGNLIISKSYHLSTLLFFLIPFFSYSQTDILVLKKNDKNLKIYEQGIYMVMQTINDQWFEGPVTAIRNDSVFIKGIPCHYQEIKIIRDDRTKLNYTTNGALLMIAGGGVLLLGAVNGLYRGDPAGEWYTTTSYITAGTLLVGGFLLMNAKKRQYTLGKKYTLVYMNLSANKN